MKKITEYKDISNNEKIDSLTDDERYDWYLRIKETLPNLKKTRDTTQLENAIKEYEIRHNIK
jgi:ribosomal protein L29